MDKGLSDRVYTCVFCIYFERRKYVIKCIAASVRSATLCDQLGIDWKMFEQAIRAVRLGIPPRSVTPNLPAYAILLMDRRQTSQVILRGPGPLELYRVDAKIS